MFRAEADAQRRTIAYARVSSHDQKDDLERQKQVLELYCTRQGWTFEVIADLGSGMNYHKKGLKRLLDDVVDGRIGRLVITQLIAHRIALAPNNVQATYFVRAAGVARFAYNGY